MLADAFLDGQYCACSDALANFLRGFPDGVLAQATGAEKETVGGWKKGKWPNSRAMVALTAKFGPAFLDAVYGPVCGADAPLSRRLDRVDADIQALKKELADAERLASRLGGRTESDCGENQRVGALARGLAAARRVTAACLAVMCLWSALADVDDDEWLRPRPAARVVRVLRVGGRREAA